MPSHPRRNQGLTLVELLMTLAVAVVLLGTALPSLGGFLERQRLAAVHNDLLAAVQHTRSLAVTQRRQAILCPTADGSTCRPGGIWDNGWMVFLDQDADGARDADEPVERVHHRDDPLQIRSSPFRPRLGFRPDGRAAGNNLTLRFCTPDGALAGGLVLNNGGRARRLQAGGDCPQ